MNGNTLHKNLMCNENLPLKKRRAYYIDPSLSNNEQDENSSTTTKPSYSQDDSYQIHYPVVPTPPSSPHIDFLRQQNYLQPSIYQYMMAQQYRTLIEQQQQQQYGYGVVEEKQKRNDLTIDEHFRKSLGDNYNSKYTGRCLTPDDSSSNGSSVIVDSIEEHFARSLAKFYPLNQDETTIDYQTTESVVDDHFAKALGSKTWGKLKEKS